jgi:hypothetical protein
VEADKGERMIPVQTFKQFCKETMNAPTDSQGRVLSTFKLTMAEFIDDLASITAFDTVEVTHDYQDPTKVLLKFHLAEDSGD